MKRNLFLILFVCGLFNMHAIATTSPHDGENLLKNITSPVFDNAPADLTTTPAGASPFSACPTSDILLDNDPGYCSAYLGDSYSNTETQNFQVANSYTATNIAGPFPTTNFPVGINYVQWDVFVRNVDPNPLSLPTNVTYSCKFNVVVTDVQVPLFMCNATVTSSGAHLVSNSDTTLYVDPGTCTKNLHFNLKPVGVAIDNCGVQGFYIDFNDASPLVQFANNTDVPFPKGTTTFTVLAKDVNGNFSGRNCTYTVIIKDNIPPVINCAAAQASVRVSTVNTGCGAKATYVVSATDNCGSATFNLTGIASNSVFPVGTTAVTYTVTDGSNNVSAPCTFNIVVKDVTAPTFTNCPMSTTVNTDAGVCTSLQTYATPVAVDNCGGGLPPVVTLFSGLASDSKFLQGINLISYSATDKSMNTSFCSFSITVIDNQPPVINCAATTATVNVSTVFGCGAKATYTVSATDNCGAPTLNFVAGRFSGSVFPVGTTAVTYTATDESKNESAPCTFNVVVTNAPTFTNCPMSTTVNTDAGACTSLQHYATPVAIYSCGEGLPSVVKPLSGFASGSKFLQGINTITYTAIAVATPLNTSTCTFTITVIDSIPPVIDCAATQASVKVSSTNTGCGAIAHYEVIATDNCGIQSLNLTGIASDSVFPVGTTAVTYTATDGSKNVSAPCTFNVVVKDVTAPTFKKCPGSTIVHTGAGVCTSLQTYATPEAVDNCGGVLAPVVSLTVGLASGSNFLKGINTITYTAKDNATPVNTSTCTFTITVIDNKLPVFNCPASVSVNSTPEVCGYVYTYTAPTAIDKCPVAGTVLTVTPSGNNLASGATFPFGTSTLSFTASDGTTTSTCTYKVTVTDTEMENVSITSAGNFCSGGVGYLTATGATNRITTYKWQLKAKGASAFVDVTAPADYTAGGGIIYTTPLLSSANNGDQYRVVLTTKCGGAMSAPFTLNVLECYVPIGFHRFPDGLPTCAQQAFRNLEKVFNIINGANWNNNSNWFTDPNMNKWFGVTMTDDGCDVKTLKVPMNLKRKASNGVDYIVGMPQSFKGSLNQISFPRMEELDLSGNNISFQIYDYNFPKLKILNLSNNNLSGNLPPLADLPSLQELYLNDNQLEGDVPAFIFNLKKFNLKNNKFTFSNLMNLVANMPASTAYSNQAAIPLSLRDGALIANTGSRNNADGMEQYTWLNNGEMVTTSSSNGFVPTTEGTYSVAVTHSELTVANDPNKNLVLTSNSIKVDATTVDALRTFTAQTNRSKVTLGISPNPATNEVKISFSNFGKGEATLNVYDVLGRLVVNKTIISFETTINISNFASGSYIVEIASNGEKFRDKLVKE